MYMDKPLAIKLQPKSIKDVIGQEHLIGKGKVLSNFVKNKIGLITKNSPSSYDTGIPPYPYKLDPSISFINIGFKFIIHFFNTSSHLTISYISIAYLYLLFQE